MSLLSQLDAFIAEGQIAKAAKPRKKSAKKPVNPNIAKKYVAPGQRLPGERHGWQTKAPPIPKPTMHLETRIIHSNKLIHPVMVHYLIDELEAATYNPFDFLGCSPIWPQHLHLHTHEE